MKEFMVNDFLLIDVNDDAIYIAKSKQDVLDYWKKYYGTPMELVGETDEEFLDALEVMDLTSDEVHRSRKVYAEEAYPYMKGSFTYYEVYLHETKNPDVKCKPILWYNV